MTLLVEILAVLLAGAALGSLVGLRGPQGVAILAVGALALLAFANGAQLVNSFRSSIQANDKLSPFQVELQPVVAGGGGVSEPFLDWARDTITRTHAPETYWLVPNTEFSASFVYQWSTFRLLPGRETDDAAAANWIVFNGVDPAHVPYDRSAFGPPIVFAKGLALAERRRVG